MKRFSIDRLYVSILLVIFGGIVLHAPLSVAVAVLWPQAELVAKSWKEILMGAAAILAAMIVWRRGYYKQIVGDRLLQVMAVYGGLYLILLPLRWQGVMASLSGLLIDLRYVALFVLVYVAGKLYPQMRHRFVWVGVAGAVIVLGFALLQVFVLPADILKYVGYSKQTIVPYLTVDLNPEYVRINSTLRGPNPLGAYAGIALAILAAAWVKGRVELRQRRPIVIAGIIGFGGIVGVWASYSRSALVAALVAVGIVLAVTVGRQLPRRAWIIGAVVIGGLIGGLLMSKGSSFASNVFLHENPTGGSLTKSDDGHVSSLADGVSRLLRQPLGGGVGSTGSASLYGQAPLTIENHYLFVAHESGWLGLLLFVVIYAIILWRLWSKRQDWLALGVFASGIGLAGIGLLLPVWADDTVSIIWWGLAALALASGEKHEQRTGK